MLVYGTNGVAVTEYYPPFRTGRSPSILVHGSFHGGWLWNSFATYLSSRGEECHVLSWFNHGGSKRLPVEQFAARNILDIATEEITHVANRLGRPPILIGHGAGAIASLAYAEHQPVERLVLIAPPAPEDDTRKALAELVSSPEESVLVPYELAKTILFTTMSEKLARKYYERLDPESPAAILESANWAAQVNLDAICVPVLSIAAELDTIAPKDFVQKLARQMGGHFELAPAVGHSDILLLEPGWQRAAQWVADWLAMAADNPK